MCPGRERDGADEYTGGGEMSDKLIAFGYYGGKFSHLDWLLPLLPMGGVNHYVEPFAGSGAVLLNRKPVHIETYNDLDGEVVNFFRVLRQQKDALVEQLTYTPFSRLEYVSALDTTAIVTDLERARRFYIRARQTMMSLVQNASPGRWAYCVGTDGGSGVDRWVSGIPKLHDVAERLRGVQIENLPAVEVIARYDDPRTLFYVDPPYVMSTRNSGAEYHTELTDDDHSKLAATLKNCRARVALSGYDSGLYRDLYKGWYVYTAKERVSFASQNRSMRTEVLWTNYDPAAINPVSQMDMFAEMLA